MPSVRNYLLIRDGLAESQRKLLIKYNRKALAPSRCIDAEVGLRAGREPPAPANKHDDPCYREQGKTTKQIVADR